jgi:hypothetical protein
VSVGGSEMSGIAMTIPMIAQTIQQFWLNAPVRDRTGLTGGFDVRIENILAPLPAALQEQLGLRIEQGREPTDVVVIDRLERPTEN